MTRHVDLLRARFENFITITFLDGESVFHYGSIADGLMKDFEVGNNDIISYKDHQIFVGYPREIIRSVVYQKV